MRINDGGSGAPTLERREDPLPDEPMAQPRNYQKFLRLKPNSQSRYISQFNQQGPRFNPQDSGPAGHRLHGLAEQYENAYYNGGGRVPISWLAQLDQSDLSLLTNPTTAHLVNPALIEAAQLASTNKELHNQWEKQAEDRFATKQLISSFVDRSTIAMRPATFAGASAQEVDFDPGTAEPGKKFSQQDFEFVRKQHFAPVERDFLPWIEKGLALAGSAITLGGMVLAAPVTIPMDIWGMVSKGDFGLPKTYQHMIAEIEGQALDFKGNQRPTTFSAGTLAQQEEVRLQQSGALREEHKEMLIQAAVLPNIVEVIRTEAPDLWNEAVAMWGDEETAQLGLMIEAADQELSKETEDQLDGWVNGMYQENEDLLRQMELSDFQIGSPIVKVLAAYGQWTMGAAAGLTAFLTDEEAINFMQDMRFEDAFEEIAQESEKGGNTPAGVLGVEGSLVGLGADFMFGMAVDPLNWFYGASRALGINGLANRTMVSLRMRSPAMKMYLGMPNEFVNPARSAVGQATFALPFVEVGKGGRLLEVMGQQTPKIPPGIWRQTDNGKVAQVLPIHYIDDWTDDIARGKVQRTALEDAKIHLENNGFDKPLEAVYSPAEGRLVFMDPQDHVMLEAARMIDGVDNVPITVRVMNESTDPPSMVTTLDNPPPSIARELQHNETTLLDEALNDWMDNPSQIQRRVDDIAMGEKAADAATYGRAEHLGVEEAVVDTINTYNRARALINWFNKKNEPTPNLVRGISTEKLDSGIRVGWDPDASTIEQPMREFGGVPGIGDRLEIGLNSATNDLLDATMFAGEDGWILQFPDDAAAVPHPSGQKLWFVSGQYIVKEVDQANHWIKLEYAGRALPEIPTGTKLPQGVPLGAHIDSPPDHLPVTRVNKADYARPSDLLGKGVLPRIDKAAFRDLVEETLMLGGDIPAARQTWAAVGLGRMYRNLVRTAWTGDFNRYFRTTYNRNHVVVGGAGGRAALVEQLEFLAADNPQFMNHWLARIIENEHHLGKSQLGLANLMSDIQDLRSIELRLTERGSTMQAMQDLIAIDPGYYSLMEGVQSMADLKGMVQEQIRSNLSAARTMEGVEGFVPWSRLVEDMMDDYRTQFIDTNPQWAEHIGADGHVPWSAISRSASADPNQVNQMILGERTAGSDATIYNKMREEYGLNYDMSEVLASFDRFGNGESMIELPATPIELLAATEVGGARYTQFSHNAWVDSVRSTVMFLDMVWKANVLLTPRTFMVMSFDELQSMFHVYGAHSVADYMLARGTRLYSRTQALLHGKPPSVRHGQQYLGPRALELIRKNQDILAETRQYQRAITDAVSQGTSTRRWGELGYPEAAAQFADLHLQNPAFRAYLRGPEAFKEWFNTTEEGMLYQYRVTIQEPGGARRPISTWDEGYQMAQMVFELLTEKAKKAGINDKQLNKFVEAWHTTAQKVDDDPTHRSYAMPNWTYRYFGDLEGTAPLYPGKGLGTEAVSRAYKVGAADPSFFRQGLIMDASRRSEMARLEALRQSHPTHRQLANADGGLSTADLAEVLGANGWPMQLLDPKYRGLLDQLLADQGFMTDGWIGRLAENRARNAVDDLTYSFEEGSRAGLAGRAVWPFGRAWAEMYGRWGRNLGAHMQVRNVWNRVPVIGKMLRGVANIAPINLRTAGFLSRFAAMNLQVSQGVSGQDNQGLFPGTTETDFTPLTFLPTLEGGPATLIPGFGPIPLTGLSEWIERNADPINDPQGYQELVDSISQAIPGIRFAGQSTFSRVWGGGNLGLLMSTLGDVQTGIFHRTFREGGYLSGDLGREIERNRAVSAALADTDLMADILAADDPEAVRLILMGVNHEADQRAGLSHFTETATRWLVPSRSQADTALDEIYSVWIHAGRELPTLTGKELGEVVNGFTDQDFQKDPELLRRTGDRIRRNFFALSPWKRDAMIAAYPTLAANLITGWQWRQNLPEGVANTDRPYSVQSGSPEELDRHNLYASRGWIIPRDSMLRPFQVVGRALDARFNTVRNMYEMQAKYINDFRWDNGLVSEQTHALLDFLVTTPEMKQLGLTDPKTLWKKWGQLGDAVVAEWGAELGMDLESEEFEAFAKNFNIPDSKERPDEAWGESFRGDMTSEYSARFRDLQLFEFAPEVQEIAALVGVRLEPGMTGEDFINEVLGYKMENESAAWNAVRYEYDGYTSERGRDFTTAMATLDDIAQNPGFKASMRDQVKEFVQWADLQSDRSYNEGDLPRIIQDEAVDRWMKMSTGFRDAPVNWDVVWRDAFQPMFGPLDWEPPVPPVLVDPETGERNREAWQPVVVGVQDGDTILVSQYKGPALSGGIIRGPEVTGTPAYHSVRLLGVMAADYGIDNAPAQADKEQLEDALNDAFRNGDTIWLVRDPAYTGSPVDGFGRELAWLYIGDEPYWFPEDMKRTNS